MRVSAPSPAPSPVFAVLALAAAGLAGCSSPVPLVSAPLGSGAPSVGDPPPAQVVAWTRTPDGVGETWTLGPRGEVLARVPGVQVAARGGLWSWRVTPSAVRTHPCPGYDAQGNELPSTETSDPGTEQRVTLERADQGGPAAVILAPPSHDDDVDTDTVADFQQTVDLVASVGPYLLVRDSTYVNMCGAHGNVGVSFQVWDAESGGAVWSSEHPEPWVLDERMLAGPRAKAATALGADETVASFAGDQGLAPALTALAASYGPEGSLELDLQFTAATCYACSDGLWSSYTMSSRQPVDRVPEELAAWATPPSGLRAFTLEHPELDLGGWSFPGVR